MRNVFIIGLLSFSIYACSHKDKLPPGILPKQQMREILWDMIRTGEFLNGFVFNKDSSLNKFSVSEKWFNKVYQLHKITKAEFEKNYAYYNDHPVLMKEMLDSLAKRQVYIRPVVRDSTHIKDSTNNRINSTQRRDSIRKSSDALRKKIIKNRKNFFKAV
ncbi:MAG: DUF4296 domain-containing protein [Chitinophagaceae bacterium]